MTASVVLEHNIDGSLYVVLQISSLKKNICILRVFFTRANKKKRKGGRPIHVKEKQILKRNLTE